MFKIYLVNAPMVFRAIWWVEFLALLSILFVIPRLQGNYQAMASSDNSGQSKHSWKQVPSEPVRYRSACQIVEFSVFRSYMHSSKSFFPIFFPLWTQQRGGQEAGVRRSAVGVDS